MVAAGSSSLAHAHCTLCIACFAALPYLPMSPPPPAPQDMGIQLVLTQEQFRSKLSVGIKAVCVDTDKGWGLIALQPDTRPPRSSSCRTAFYAIYTSGSTGRHGGCCGGRGLLWTQGAAVEAGPLTRGLHI